MGLRVQSRGGQVHEAMEGIKDDFRGSSWSSPMPFNTPCFMHDPGAKVYNTEERISAAMANPKWWTLSGSPSHTQGRKHGHKC